MSKLIGNYSVKMWHDHLFLPIFAFFAGSFSLYKQHGLAGSDIVHCLGPHRHYTTIHKYNTRRIYLIVFDLMSANETYIVNPSRILADMRYWNLNVKEKQKKIRTTQLRAGNGTDGLGMDRRIDGYANKHCTWE